MKILLIWELDDSWPQSPRIPSLSLVIGWQAYVTIPLNVLLEIKELPKNAVRGPTCWKLGDRKEDRTPLSPRIYAFTLSFLLAAEAGLISKSPPLTLRAQWRFPFSPTYRLSGSSLQTCPFGVTEELNGGCTTVPKKCPTPYSAQGKTNCRHWCHNENIGICEWAMLNSSTYSTVNHPFQSENPRSKIPTTYVLSL